MSPAEQFKLVAQILKTAKPGTPDRIWLQDAIKMYQAEYQGAELRPYLEGLLKFAVYDSKTRPDWEVKEAQFLKEMFDNA